MAKGRSRKKVQAAPVISGDAEDGRGSKTCSLRYFFALGKRHQSGQGIVIPAKRSASRDRAIVSVSICYDPGLYLGTADLSIANESESISP